MGALVLDASVIVAVMDPSEMHHRAAVAALRLHADSEVVVPASAFAESLVRAARAGRLPAAKTQIASFTDRVVPLDAVMAERTAELRAAHRALRLPDALVLATGDVIEADGVLTCDARWSAWSQRVEVVRPGAPPG